MEELQIIQNKIYEVRGQRVMLDFDLAKIYQVETKYLKRAVRANAKRFPSDFMFELTDDEHNSLKDRMRCNFCTSSSALNEELQEDHGGRRYMPFAFTEEGVAMLSGVLHSKVAIDVNITIMRAFVSLRSQLAGTSSVAAELLQRLERAERQLGTLSQLQSQHDALDKRLNAMKSDYSVSIEILEDKIEDRFAKQERCLGGLRSWLDSLDDRCFMSELERDARRPHSGCLDMATWIEEYSPRALVIFTVVKSDRFLLKSIGARFNPWLTWQGRRSCGWILPKSRGKELLAILPAGYDVRILERACGNKDREERNEE